MTEQRLFQGLQSQTASRLRPWLAALPLIVLSSSGCGVLEDVLDETKRQARDAAQEEVAPASPEWDPEGLTPPPPAKPAMGSWIEFDSEEMGFKASFPQAPKTEIVPTPTVVGNIDQTMFNVSRGADYFAVSVASYPEAIVSASNPATMLDGARDGAVSNVNGVLASETQLEIQGWPGRRIRVTATVEGMELVMDAVICLAGNRLYQGIVVRPAGAHIEDEVEHFLSSLAPRAKP